MRPSTRILWFASIFGIVTAAEEKNIAAASLFFLALLWVLLLAFIDSVSAVKKRK